MAHVSHVSYIKLHMMCEFSVFFSPLIGAKSGPWLMTVNEKAWSSTWHVLLLPAGAPDGRIQHRCPGVEAELLRHVRAGQEQRVDERILAEGLTFYTRRIPRFVPLRSPLLNFPPSRPSSSSGEEILAWPRQHQRGSGGQRHQAHQRPRHPRGLSLRDHVRGAELDHAGHPHRRAGDHRGGGQSVYGSRAGTEVKKTAEKKTKEQKLATVFPVFPSSLCTDLPGKHTRPAETRVSPPWLWRKELEGTLKLCTLPFCDSNIRIIFFNLSHTCFNAVFFFEFYLYLKML